MRNLKRLLTMVMAIAMLMSLMVVGAGATSFKDDKDITHKEAVEKMASLNIINGRDDGNFDPAGIVTRAEMAKMICVAMNGGNDPKLSSSSVVTSSFNDTKGHWAEGYIEYCVNMGIAAGLGDKTFGPDQKVTASQAAKMLLVALGYDATFEKFTGPTWALNSNKIAMQKGLYDEIQGIDPNSPMTRDAAAQMIHNFCDANMVKYEFGISGTGSAVTGVKQAVDVKVVINGTEKYETVLTKYYKLITVEGYLNSISYDSKKKEYSYAVYKNAGTLANDGNGNSTLLESFKSTVDFSDMYGMQVEVLYRDKDGSKDYNTGDSVYDINMNDSVVIASGVMDDFGKYDASGKTVKFAGKVYDLQGNTVPAMAAYTGATLNNLNGTGSTPTGTISNAGAAYNVKLVDNNDDGKIDLIICTPFTVQKVTYLGSDTTTFVGQAGATSEASKDNDDYNAYTGIAKDDYVAFYKADNNVQRTDTVVKMDLKTGKVAGVKGSGTSTEALIDGTWYTLAAGMTVIPKDGDSLDYIAIGSVMFYAKITERGASSKNILAVINADWISTSTVTPAMKAKVMLPDDTKKEVIIAKVDGTKMTGSGDVAATPNTTEYVANKLVKGAMYTFKVNSDGEYELERLVDGVNGNLAGNDKFETGAGYILSGKKVGTYELADTARVIVVNTKNTVYDAKVYTGKEFKNGNAGNYGDYSYSLVSKVSNISYTTMAVIVEKDDSTLPSFSGGSKFAYMTDGAYISGDYRYFPVWNGTEDITLKEKDTGSVSSFVKGQIITFDAAADGLIKNVALASAHNLKSVAITAYDGTKKIQFSDGASKEIDNADTTVLYIDSKDTKGIKEASIQDAASDAYGNLIPNAYYVGTGTTLDLLVVDVRGNIPTQGMNPILPSTFTTTPADADTATELSTLFTKTSGTVKVNGDLNLAASQNISIPTGQTLQVIGNLTIPANTTVNVGGANGSLTVSGTINVNGALAVTGDFNPGVATVVNGTLTATGEVAATVTGVGTVTAASLNSYASVHPANVIVTGNVTAPTTLYAGTCNYTFKGDVSAALTLNTASKVIFEKTLDLTNVIPTGVAGATVKFVVAPTATTFQADNNADGFFMNGTTVLDLVTKISTDKVYTYTTDASNSNDGWVTP